MFARWLAAVTAAIPAAAALLMAQSPPEPASLAGTVTNSVTAEPIVRAHVTANCRSGEEQSEQQAYGALTNAKGEFSLTHLPPGNCWLSAQRVGFVTTPQQTSHSLSSGTHKEGIKLTLLPTGAITGRVFTSAGEPAQAMSVFAESASGVQNGVATTDEKGQFRMGGLLPGKYRVKARKESLPFPPEIRADGSVEMRDASTYFPDSVSAKMAQRMEVKPGAEVSGVEIRLVQVPVLKVSGKVTGASGEMKNVNVSAQPSGQGTSAKADGTFEIWRLDPGKYELRAQRWNSQEQLHSAPIEIEVANANIENLELQLMAAFEVGGQLRFEDEQARETIGPPARPGATPPPPPQRQLMLQSINPFNPQQYQAPLAADDSFVQANVQPGIYRVQVNGVRGYVKSVRAGNTEKDGHILDLRGGSPGPITVTLSSNYCEVSGVVSDSKGPVADVHVALARVEDNVNLVTTQTNASGAYHFRTSPGKYKLLLLDPNNANFNWGPRPGGIDDLEGETVELNAGDKIVKDLQQK